MQETSALFSVQNQSKDYHSDKCQPESVHTLTEPYVQSQITICMLVLHIIVTDGHRACVSIMLEMGITTWTELRNNVLSGLPMFAYTLLYAIVWVEEMYPSFQSHSDPQDSLTHKT